MVLPIRLIVMAKDDQAGNRDGAAACGDDNGSNNKQSTMATTCYEHNRIYCTHTQLCRLWAASEHTCALNANACARR